MGIAQNWFDYIQTEEATIYHKPDPLVFEPTILWLKSLHIKPSEALYVGDGLHDMTAAIGAGFEFVGVTTGLVTQDEFSDRKVKSVNKLSDLLG